MASLSLVEIVCGLGDSGGKQRLEEINELLFLLLGAVRIEPLGLDAAQKCRLRSASPLAFFRICQRRWRQRVRNSHKSLHI